MIRIQVKKLDVFVIWILQTKYSTATLTFEQIKENPKVAGRRREALDGFKPVFLFK
jgi:hypothetical protein